METKSVIKFLQSNNELVCEYFSKVREGSEVSYSGMLASGLLSGTTEEGVNFDSSRIERQSVTAYLISKFSGNVLELDFSKFTKSVVCEDGEIVL